MSATPRTHPLAAILTVLATAGALIAMALSNGSYDLVPRQTAAIVLWWAVGVGSLVFLRPPGWSSRASLATVGFAVLMVLWIAVNASSSISHERTGTELARDVCHVAPLVLVGWVLPRSLWRWVIVGVAVGGVGVAAAALAHRLHPSFLGGTDIVLFTNTSQRLSSPMGYWNAVGSAAAITLLLLVAIAAHARAPLGRALALAATPICIATAYVTYSRSAFGAAIIGLVVLVAASRNRFTVAAYAIATGAGGAAVVSTIHGQNAIAQGTGTAGAGAVLTAVVLAAVVLAVVGAVGGIAGLDRLRMPPRVARVATIATLAIAVIAGGVLASKEGRKAWDQFKTPEASGARADPSARLTTLNTTRYNQWKAAIDAWHEKPTTGFGAGTFELVYNQRETNGEFVRDAHNAFIEALVEQGTVGLVLLLGFLGSAAVAIVLALRRAATVLDRGLLAGATAGVSAFVLGTALDWFWEVTGLAMFALVLIGAALAASGGPEPAATEQRDARRVPGWVPRAALVAVALVAVLVELPGLVGTSEVRRSARDVAAGDLVAARGHADQAIDALPWASSPFLQRALVDEQAGAWPSAIRAITLAERRDPQDWRLPLVRARIEAKAGHPQEALTAFRTAKKLRPHGNFFR